VKTIIKVVFSRKQFGPCRSPFTTLLLYSSSLSSSSDLLPFLLYSFPPSFLHPRLPSPASSSSCLQFSFLSPLKNYLITARGYAPISACLLICLKLRSLLCVLCSSSSYFSARCCSWLCSKTLVIGQRSDLHLLLGILCTLLSALSSALLSSSWLCTLSSSLFPCDNLLPLPVILPHISRFHRFGFEFSRHRKLSRLTPTILSCTMESAGSLADCVHHSRLRKKPQTFVS
jgi:hypothetical protein